MFLYKQKEKNIYQQKTLTNGTFLSVDFKKSSKMAPHKKQKEV